MVHLQARQVSCKKRTRIEAISDFYFDGMDALGVWPRFCASRNIAILQRHAHEVGSLPRER